MNKEMMQCPFSRAKLRIHASQDARAVVLICPGGGYNHVSEREGEPVARALAGYGYASAILDYTVADGNSPTPLGTLPLREAAWAIRAIREKTDKKVFACGFSAGGHLAATLGVHWDDAAIFPEENLRRLQRPDGLILCYAVLSSGEKTHEGSILDLAGTDAALRAYFCLEKHVNAQTPPAFLWHTAADDCVPAENSLLFFQALRKAGVSAELHIYPFGAHGLSLATPELEQPEKRRYADAHIATWIELCAGWLDLQNR